MPVLGDFPISHVVDVGVLQGGGASLAAPGYRVEDYGVVIADENVVEVHRQSLNFLHEPAEEIGDLVTTPVIPRERRGAFVPDNILVQRGQERGSVTTAERVIRLLDDCAIRLDRMRPA